MHKCIVGFSIFPSQNLAGHGVVTIMVCVHR